MNLTIRFPLAFGGVVFTLVILSLLVCSPKGEVKGAEESFSSLAQRYTKEVRPLLASYCVRCHSAKREEGDINLDSFTSLDQVRKSPRTWQKVLEMLDTAQMPPPESKKPSEAEKKTLSTWVRDYLKTEARSQSGDPGPVVLRRLNNAEYTYTINDLTGVALQPVREFPVDSAAGEGFTNTGQSLVMSPALLAKYLDAAKDIAARAVLLPDGIRFSPSTTRSDWTNEILTEIRQTYRQFSTTQGATLVNLQGIIFNTNDGGRLPLLPYLTATLAQRDELQSRRKDPDTVAKEHGLNAKYCTSLWKLLTSDNPSPLIEQLQRNWKQAKTTDAPALVGQIEQWQKALTRFQSVGHMKPWMVPVSPLMTRQDVRYKLPASAKDVVFHLAASTAGDGDTDDVTVWQNPRFIIPGRADLPLRDVRAFTLAVIDRQRHVFNATAKLLVAADEARERGSVLDVAALAQKHKVDTETLQAWLEYLGISGATPKLTLLQGKLPKGSYDFIAGWGRPETPSIIANSSNRPVRIPGNMKPGGVCVHPSPTLQAAVGWRAPVTATIRLTGRVTHAHPECGNGVTWSLELRRGSSRQRLGSGIVQGARAAALGPIDELKIHKGDLISLLIGPRDGNHSCDLTDLELDLQVVGNKDQWSLTRDISPDIHAGNPHNDRQGNKDVWHFYTEPVTGGSGHAIPVGSLLARWAAATSASQRRKLADAVEKLLVDGPPADESHPDAQLHRLLTSLQGPLLAKIQVKPGSTRSSTPVNAPGVDAALFGKHPAGAVTEPTSLCLKAPTSLEVRLPGSLFAGAEFVSGVSLHPRNAEKGSVQVAVSADKPNSLTALRSDTPVIVGDRGVARRRWEQGFDDFRKWFPSALCYVKIVPVDEVVTLTLFHREDEPLCRLMLDDRQKAQLDQLWEELHFVSHDALTLVDAYKQLMEYATQDADPKVFEPFRKPIHDRAAAFRKTLVAAEPRHVTAVVELAARAYRRPLTEKEKQELKDLYAKLRKQELPHDQAIRLTLARVFMSPAFLYRLEKAPEGTRAGRVSDLELASRLSYFLWSSLPDRQLQETATKKLLQDDRVLLDHTRRMLKDQRTRRLAIEFGAQWLHVHGFDRLDEKSERHFPTFKAMKSPLYEETIHFLTDFFQRDGSVLSLLDADHTFLNEALAKHYGIPGVTGPEWRRVEGVKKFGRGGILALGTTLAKQSGASRTSPILRGNWVSEVLLGEKLPRPPKDVPQLPEDEGDSKLTVRQLVEKHSSDPRCAVCHSRIDAFGFALEGYDAVGRRRQRDLGNRLIDVKSRLKDGTTLDGLGGLRKYLLTTRKADFLRQFCRKFLGYALGRGVQLSDEPLLDEMLLQLHKNEYRISTAIEVIVRSPQFRQIRGRDFVVSDSR